MATEIDPVLEEMHREFAMIAKDEMGSGYVPDFYINFAAPFTHAAMHYREQAIETERNRIATAIAARCAAEGNADAPCFDCTEIIALVTDNPVAISTRLMIEVSDELGNVVARYPSPDPE